MIALAQGVVVFFLCLASKSRAASIVIGGAGLVVAVMVGDNRYGWLDVLFVAIATAAAIKSLGPADKEAKPSEVLVFAGKAVKALIMFVLWGGVALWFYANKGVQSSVTQEAPLPHEPPHPTTQGLESGALVSEKARLENRETATVGAVSPREGSAFQRDGGRGAPAHQARSGPANDKRRCLDLNDNAAVARCVGG